MEERTVEPSKLTFGNQIIGTWMCLECNERYYPRQLQEETITVDHQEVKCPKCKTGSLVYDEAA